MLTFNYAERFIEAECLQQTRCYMIEEIAESGNTKNDSKVVSIRHGDVNQRNPGRRVRLRLHSCEKNVHAHLRASRTHR